MKKTGIWNEEEGVKTNRTVWGHTRVVLSIMKIERGGGSGIAIY